MAGDYLCFVLFLFLCTLQIKYGDFYLPTMISYGCNNI